MTKIKIVTDSSITIEPELAKELDITIVPLSVMVDGVVYSDADLEEGEFLRLMQSSKALPKTSQPPVGVFAEVFEYLAADGAQIISIHMSHALSGTVEAARQGATLANADVTVIDSSFTDQAMKFQVVEAAKMAQEGAELAAVLQRIEEVKDKTELYIGLSTLENLVKGGRIGRVSGLISSLLNIRVIMQMKNHQLEPIVKGRGAKTFKKWLDDLAESLKSKQVAEIGISYAGGPDFANEMKAILQPYVEKAISVLETGSIIAERAPKAARQPERATTVRARDADSQPARAASTPASEARPAAGRTEDARAAGASAAHASAQEGTSDTRSATAIGNDAAGHDGSVSGATAGRKSGASASAAGGAAAGQGHAAGSTQAAAGAGRQAGATVADATATQPTLSTTHDSLADQIRQGAQVQPEELPVSETELQQLARQMGVVEPSSTTDVASATGSADAPDEAAASAQDGAPADEIHLTADARSTDAEGPVVAGAPVAAGSMRRASAASGAGGQPAHDGRMPSASSARPAASTPLPQTGTASEAASGNRPVTTADTGPAALPTTSVAAGRVEGGSFSLGMALPTPGAHSPVRTDGSPLLSSRIDSPIHSAEFKEQFARQVAGVVVQGQDRAEIRLTPAELGPIRIRVSLNADDAALDISAAHAATRAAIESSMSTLKQMLADHGLRLADYRMDQGNNAAFLSQQRQPGQENGAAAQQFGAAFGQNGDRPSGERHGAGQGMARTGRTTDSRPTAVSGSTGGMGTVGNGAANGRLDLFA